MAKVNKSAGGATTRKSTGKRGRPTEPRVESAIDTPNTPSEGSALPPQVRILPPDWMLKEGKEVWERIYPTIKLHPGKADLFSAMCQRFGHAIKLERLVKKKGNAHTENTDGVHEANISKAATAQWLAGLKLAEKLGITTLALGGGSDGDGGTGKGGGVEGKLDPVDDFIFNNGTRPNNT